MIKIGRGSSKAGKTSGSGAKYTYTKAVIEPGKPTKYAVEIFDYNYREAREHVKRWGNGEFQFTNLSISDDSPIMSTRTFKGVQSKINTERAEIDLDEEFGVLSKDEAQQRRVALNAVQKTLNDSYEVKEYLSRKKKR